MIFILMFVEKSVQYDTKHDFSVKLRSGSNSGVINRFWSNTGKVFTADKILTWKFRRDFDGQTDSHVSMN